MAGFSPPGRQKFVDPTGQSEYLLSFAFTRAAVGTFLPCISSMRASPPPNHEIKLMRNTKQRLLAGAILSTMVVEPIQAAPPEARLLVAQAPQSEREKEKKPPRGRAREGHHPRRWTRHHSAQRRRSFSMAGPRCAH